MHAWYRSSALKCAWMSRALLDSGAPSLSLDQGDLVPFAAQWPDLRRDQPAASGTSPQQQQQDTKGNSKAPLPSSTAGNVAFLAGQQPVDATATAAAATAGPFGLLPLPLPARLQQRRASTDGSASGQQAPSALPEAEDLAGELPFAAAAARSAANANSNSNTAVNPLVPGGWAVGGGVTGARAVVPWWRVIGGQAADTQRYAGTDRTGWVQQVAVLLRTGYGACRNRLVRQVRVCGDVPCSGAPCPVHSSGQGGA